MGMEREGFYVFRSSSLSTSHIVYTTRCSLSNPHPNPNPKRPAHPTAICRKSPRLTCQPAWNLPFHSFFHSSRLSPSAPTRSPYPARFSPGQHPSSVPVRISKLTWRSFFSVVRVTFSHWSFVLVSEDEILDEAEERVECRSGPGCGVGGQCFCSCSGGSLWWEGRGRGGAPRLALGDRWSAM